MSVFFVHIVSSCCNGILNFGPSLTFGNYEGSTDGQYLFARFFNTTFMSTFANDPIFS